MRKYLIAILAGSALILPLAAFALEGIGPRVTIVGTVEQINLSEKQSFEMVGGEYKVRATNGQLVTVLADDVTEMISEGRLSRKNLKNTDVREGMMVRIRGLRIGSDSMTASLFVALNIQKNPALSGYGIIQSIQPLNISVLMNDGKTRSFQITNETEVYLSYSLRGPNALSLIGKEAFLTFNPSDAAQVKIIRITGEPRPVRP